MRSARVATAALLGAAAVAAIARSANASFAGRFAGVLAAFAVGLVAFGVWRERPWALGSAFFIAVFWFWAALALRVQSVIGARELIVWIAWALTVMVATVQARAR